VHELIIRTGSDNFGLRNEATACRPGDQSRPARACLSTTSAAPTATESHCQHICDRRAVAGALAGAVIGYVVQSVFADTEIDPAAYCEGLALLN
jgi:hypothetical protein